MIRTQIQLTEAQHKFLREKAVEYNVSMAELVRQGVELLAQRDQKPSRDELQRQALSIKTYDDIDGATDVSINHDQYLAKIYAETRNTENDLR